MLLPAGAVADLAAGMLAQGGAIRSRGTKHSSMASCTFVRRVPVVDDALLLHGCMWAAVTTAPAAGNEDNGSSCRPTAATDAEVASCMLEVGLLPGEARCVATGRTF